jgi:predicted metalloprotease
MTLWRTLVILLLMLALLATACGSREGNNTNTRSDDRPTMEDTVVVPPVDDEVGVLVEQVDDTPVNAAGESEVPAASAVNLQDASSQNAQAIAAVETYLTGVLDNADRAWTYWFKNNGLSEPLVSYDVITPTDPGWQSNCTGMPSQVVSDIPNAYYCSADALQQGFDGAIYLPATTMLKTWSGDILGLGQQSQQAGDFAAAAIAAHEFGHHVQDEISIQTNTLEPNGKYKELLADCFAGNWAANVYYQGYLEAGDFEEAVYAVEAIGDDTGSHGTSAERTAAFQLGYHGMQGGTPGDPATCIQYYWRYDTS